MLTKWVVGRGDLSEFSGCIVPAPRACFSSTFHKNCGRGESHGPTTCLRTVIGGKQDMLPVK